MKTLIIVDVQHDFMPGGALGIGGGDAIIPVINRLIPRFDHVLATLDWHPPHHISFASTHHKKVGDVIRIGTLEQILWPDHCVQKSYGAQLDERLDQTRIERVFHKGSDPNIDSYSTFFDNMRKRSTGLADYLSKHRFNDLYFAGLATDYCVLYSALDALELGFRVWVIRDACKAINRKPHDEERAFEKMRQKGAVIITSKEMG